MTPPKTDAYPCCRHCAEDREHDVPPEGHAIPCDDCTDDQEPLP